MGSYLQVIKFLFYQQLDITNRQRDISHLYNGEDIWVVLINRQRDISLGNRVTLKNPDIINRLRDISRLFSKNKSIKLIINRLRDISLFITNSNQIKSNHQF